MYKRIWLVVAIMLSLSVFGTMPRVQGADDVIAPKVVDSAPARGEELPVDASITFYFDEPMDQPSVQAAFSTNPVVKGDFSWSNDSTAVFKPATPLNRGTMYTFTVGAAAKSKAGAPIKDTYSLKLRTPNKLEVSQILPANNAKDIEAAPTITVIFTRPVIPLGTAEDMAKQPSPITLLPNAEGTGEWLNTSIYTFKPTQLQGGTRYAITVKKGLKDVTGSILQNDVISTFSTVAPRVIEVAPRNDAGDILRDAKITVTFSQPMDTKATEGAFSLKGKNGQAVAGDFTWGKDNFSFTFKPQSLLDYETTYQAKVDATKARSASGGRIQADATASFLTVSKPEIAYTEPQNNTTTDPYGGFRVQFTAPMKLADFKSRVTVDPKPGQLYDDNVDEAGFFYQVGFGTEPSTDYTVTIDANGLTDIYGTQLILDPQSKAYSIVGPNKIQVKYTTLPYPKQASLETGGQIGLYSAYSPQTRVFTTHRNISSLELALWSVPAQDFLNLVGSNRYEFLNTWQPKDFLRRWQVPVENPTNILRYDLLTISGQGPNLGQQSNVACPGAPDARVAVGDTVVVLSDDPTPQRVRDTAGLTGKVIGQVKPGGQFNVIDGPICADKFLWWKVTTTDGKLTGWTAEGDRSRYYIQTTQKGSPATPQATSSGQSNGQALKPGFYWLRFSAPELPDNERDINHYMIVATANITFKVTEKALIAWVTDLKTGKPLPNVDVQFYTGTTSALSGTAKTDAQGLARYALPKNFTSLYTDAAALVNDGTNFGMSLGNWADGIDPWYFNQDSNFSPQDYTVYMYTDRALYRPGEPVYFRGVLRNRDDVTYSLTSLKTVPIEIFDDQGQSIYQKEVPVTPYGTFSDKLDLDPEGSLGGYRIVARPNVPVASENPPEFWTTFSVAEYRLPEFKVTTKAEKDQVVQGDKVKVTVDSSYFFGGAVANANVSYTVYSDPYYFNYTGKGNYNFTDFNEDSGESFLESPNAVTVAEGTGQTDAQGKFTIEVPANLGKNPQSQTFTVEARITDASNQEVAGRSRVTVNQGLFYIGVTPEEYVGVAKQAQNIDLISVGWDSQPEPGQDISVKVVERNWSSVQTVEPDTGRTVWTYDVKETPVTDGVVHTDQDGKAIYEFTPDHGGIYKIYATSRDSKGNQITSSAFAWVAGPDYVPWRQQNSNRIDLKIDKTDYKIGETAEILIASPFQGETTALVTVERGKLLKTEVITMTTNSTIYKLPITPDMAPNAYVSVMVVKGVDAKNPVAAFRMGLIQLGVETDHLKLNIEVTSDKPQAGPREKVNYKLHVTDYAGKPVQAEVGLALVDQALLSLLPDQSTPILEYFYGKQGLGVRTASTLTLSVDQQTQQILNTIKGGGGGGPEGGIFQVRQEFVTTPLWAPAVETDVNGDATVPVTLPDNLTTWHLDVRAVTKPTGESNTTLVGQTTSDLLSTKPLLIRPQTPRFYVVGDTSVLAAVVNNNTDQAQDVNVHIETSGFTVKGDAALKANIPSRGQARFEWPVEVQDVNAVGVTFFAATADNKYTDAAKSAVGQGADKTLPVLRYEAPETVGTGGVIGKDGGNLSEGILLPRNFKVTQGTLDIKLDPSLAASTTDALEALDNYPYESLESVVSRFLPNLVTYKALKQLGLDKPAMKDDLNNLILDAVQRIYNEQHVDGGWGWFVRDDSSPLMTAYVIIGLSEAKSQGFNINANVLSKAVLYVEKNLQDVPDQAPTWQLNRQAFLTYALARANAGNFSRLVRLFSVKEKMSTFARGYLAMSFHILGPNDKRYTDPLISDFQNRAIASATGQHWEESYDDWYNWNTDTRTTAIILNALVEIQPDNPLIPNVVRWLMVARTADYWETTQETAWAVMGLTDWMLHTGELKPNYTFGVSVNDKSLADGKQVTPANVEESVRLHVAVKDLLADQVNKLTFNRTGGDGILYYTAHLTAYLPVQEIKALTRGISISRKYSLQSDKDQKPIAQAKVGDTVRVTLTIVAPSDLNYVVVTDPIPAGTESINPELETSSSVGQAPQLREDDPLSHGWGWWWFSKTDLRDDRTVMYATYLPKGTYQFTYSLRVGAEGEYRVIPPTGQETYFPEVYGRGDGSLFTVLPADK